LRNLSNDVILKVMGEQTIGIIGGGQLGRMLTLAALPLGFKVVVLNPSPNSPASQVGAQEIVADLYDSAAIKKLAQMADFITIEIEHLNTKVLEAVSKIGKKVNPAPATIKMLQDKLLQKQFLESNEITVAPFAEIKDYENAKQVLEDFGGKMLLKARHGGYDGRGNYVVSSEEELKIALKKFKDQKVYAEVIVPFQKELAVIVARDFEGNIKTYPVVETIHERSICQQVIAPADISNKAEKNALKLAQKTAKHLEGAGVFAIEMFLLDEKTVLVNESAPRVHNSGHFTMDACATSQFEQHIRAITGLPLGETTMLMPAAVMVNVLGERNGDTKLKGLGDALGKSYVNVHVYGKSPTKVDRKMGHITALGKDAKEAHKRATKARSKIGI
jgi:5-(carboxyamino)imidazole ribonucleotide synthase